MPSTVSRPSPRPTRPRGRDDPQGRRPTATICTPRRLPHSAHHNGTGSPADHTVAYGPWWFGSDGLGRFDLPLPRGACYLADSAVAAVRERLGIVLGGRPVVPASLLTYVVVSTLHLPENRDLAYAESSDATRFGVIRERDTIVPSAVPQVWARAFDAAGIGGVAYGPRFTTGDAVSYAVFGPAGIAPWPVDPEPVRAVDVPGVPVALDPPRRWDVTVVRPPRTRIR